MTFRIKDFTLFLSLVSLLSCAVVVHPTGGPEDREAPFVLSSSPDSNQTAFHKTVLVIRFNEYVTIKDPNGIILSPPPQQKPKLLVIGKELHIGLKELRSNTTYNLTLYNAIADINEENILPAYSISFSSGEELDSGTITGRVIDRLVKSPLNNITVILLPEKVTDSVSFPLFVTKTDPSGNFRFQNLPSGKQFSIAAFEDINSNYRAEPDEKFGYAETFLVNDTTALQLELSSQNTKVIPQVMKVNPVSKHRTKISVKNLSSNNYIINSISSSDKREKLYVNHFHPDTLLVFDTYIYNNNDKMYLLTNSNGEALDTLSFQSNETLPDSLIIQSSVQGTYRLSDSLFIRFSNPVTGIDTSQISILKDSITPIPFTTQTIDLFTLYLDFEKQSETHYTVFYRKAAFKDVLGQASKPDTINLVTDGAEDYGTISLSWPLLTGSAYIIQLLKDPTKEPDFTFYSSQNKFTTPLIPKGEYHIRIIYDANQNKAFDGVTPLKSQPEKVLLHREIVKVSSKWTLELNLVD